MITEDLIEYIQNQRRKNIPDSLIASRLEKASWHTDDIREGFRKLDQPITPVTPLPQPESPLPQEIKQEPPFISEGLSMSVQELELKKGQKEVEEAVSSPIDSVVPPLDAKPLTPIIPLLHHEVPIVRVAPVSPLPDIQKKELPQASVPKVASPVPTKIFSDVVRQPTFSMQSSSSVKPVFRPEIVDEPIPSLIPKSSTPAYKSRTITDSFTGNLPESAILTTYERDVVTTKRASMEDTPAKKKNKKRLIVIALVILLVSALAGAIFAMNTGSFGIKSFSLIKKDPKMVILGTSRALALLTTHESETHVRVSFPSFANITNGLVSGDRVTSSDTDFVSIDMKNTTVQSPKYLRNHAFHIKSSLIKSDIISGVTDDGTTAYVQVPDLRSFMGTAAPIPGLVSIPVNQVDPLLSLLPITLADTLRKFDVYMMLSKGMPLFVKDNINASFQEFITSGTVLEKEQEEIRGVLTYHYQITMDRASVKKFLGSILDTFVINLPEETKKNIDEAFGATTINTFDVWVGKNDGMLYQYEFSATVPLSKVINLDDKGIAGNTVTLDWKTTYNGFNNPLQIEVPRNAIPISEFLKFTRDQNIKNILSTLPQTMSSLRSAQGSYGARTNPTGSCTNPNPSSLFSPLGHTKGSSNAVSAIASVMNELLSATNGAGSCFSTSTAWAVSFPFATDPVSSYCVDNKSVVTIISAPLQGTSCK